MPRMRRKAEHALDFQVVRHCCTSVRSTTGQVASRLARHGHHGSSRVHRDLPGAVHLVRQHRHRAHLPNGSHEPLVRLPARVLRGAEFHRVVVQSRRDHLPEPERRLLVQPRVPHRPRRSAEHGSFIGLAQGASVTRRYGSHRITVSRVLLLYSMSACHIRSTNAYLC